jgi:glycosyltransferase involved in cell wall biosynthesis
MKRAIIYLDFLPTSTGSGADLRCYSNVRAFQDLGYKVELIVIGEADTRRETDIAGVSITHASREPQDLGIVPRLAFRMNIGTRPAFRYAFPGHEQSLRIVGEQLRRHPDTVHFIEGERISSILPFLRSSRVVWSHHDSIYQTALATTRIACDLDDRKPTRAEERACRFARRAESKMLAAAPLILTISDADRVRFAARGYRNVAWLPMSIPNDAPIRLASPQWMAGGRLTLLHLGRTAHLPSFRSLEFLLDKVLPALTLPVLERIRILVAGTNDGRDARSVRIRHLAERWPNQVEMLGFAKDLQPLVAAADLQVVGSSDATGLRTRIIESFAWGLPVVSTRTGADGIVGLRDNENILLRDTANELSSTLEQLIHDPAALPTIAAGGRQLYERVYSRSAVAGVLAHHLDACVRPL